MEQPKDQEQLQQSPKVRDMISLLESDHNTPRQRRTSSSSTISNTSSIVSMISSGTQVEADITTAQLLKKLRDIINGGTTTNTQGGKPKYRAYLKADIACRANKLLDNLEFKIESLDARPQEPSSNNIKETKETGASMEATDLPENITNAPPTATKQNILCGNSKKTSSKKAPGPFDLSQRIVKRTRGNKGATQKGSGTPRNKD
ncbi:hypothetical protein HNY73_021130 [Argiope bruennichi]|uniref:Uncharacterized protein n=1 Tax=Argiope bruennichi TaxID=94029 RepID=A0A8T0ECY2_ARGBR|nr:hypothetical protein HNY73_021130 [Argiope bruennichi]